jgi:subtilase family serine protease
VDYVSPYHPAASPQTTPPPRLLPHDGTPDGEGIKMATGNFEIKVKFDAAQMARIDAEIQKAIPARYSFAVSLLLNIILLSIFFAVIVGAK